MTTDVKDFLAQVNGQMHKADIFKDGDGEKIGKIIATHKQWEEEAADRKQKEEQAKAEREKPHATLSADSLRQMLPRINQTMKDNEYKFVGEVGGKVERIHNETPLNLARLTKSELEAKLETARHKQEEYLKESGEGAKQCANEQGAIISFIEQEIDRRGESSEPSQADIDKANAERVARINKVIEDNERFMAEMNKRINRTMQDHNRHMMQAIKTAQDK